MLYPNVEQSSQMVAKHYDELDLLYRQIWGIHLHHGLWYSGKESVATAVQQLVELVAQQAQLQPGQSVCDIGCGYGATSLMLTQQWYAKTTAITLSEAQYQYAISVNPSNSNPHFILGNWIENKLPSANFDVAISIESSEHMPDKEGFFREAFRVLKPGGRMVVCAWLATESASAREKRYLLEPICREARLPSMGSKNDYIELFKQAGFENIRYTDLSYQVKKTWSICARRLFVNFFTNSNVYRLLFNKHASECFFAITVFRMLIAYRRGCLNYGIFVGEKLI